MSRAARLTEERLFAPDLARCHRGEPPSTVGERLGSRLRDELSSLL